MAPFERDLNTVFQDYALFPHMSLIDNVAYGLRVRGMARKERHERAREALTRAAGEICRPQARPALRRPAPARGPGPGAGGAAQGPAAGRAARRPGPQAPAADAGGTQGTAALPRHHLHLRHPRPGGGPDHERPDRRLQQREHGADRHGAEIYERPGGAFVANFVGTSNIFDADPRPETLSAARSRSASGRRRLRLSWAAAPEPRDGVTPRPEPSPHSSTWGTPPRSGAARRRSRRQCWRETLPGGDAGLLDRRVTVSWDDDAAVWLPPSGP